METPITPKTVTDILPHFVQLPIEEQDTLIEKHPKLLNVQLQIMLYSELDSLKTFKFICKYGQHLQSEFIQIFIYNLLLSNNLKATTTLLHQLLHKIKSFKCQMNYGHYIWIKFVIWGLSWGNNDIS